MSFTDEEAAYLRENPMGRLATVAPDGSPDVVPVAVEFDGAYLWVGGGSAVTRTRKFRNVAAGGEKVALVVDDTVSFAPFTARGIRIYGAAEQPFERVGMVGPGVYMRIAPTVSWSWNMAGEPVGETWYATRRAHHGRHGRPRRRERTDQSSTMPTTAPGSPPAWAARAPPGRHTPERPRVRL
ncbi:PPOX class F420-dependent oxidoreductase [Streptomonospora salina]|uniref:Pyridoxamine 5'-phosphate oxidase family protein n=1 Tax=Streptomonospora salina TaxID=104205 RepID=A0A841E3B3_9ACTN|nr:PPOX class F420-dependent oxidoreductase [Streptomonospora salina]MBB5997526.1 pyridoxamine 5'-phosphate oxidase family protein [Streptomonospora salina]